MTKAINQRLEDEHLQVEVATIAQYWRGRTRNLHPNQGMEILR